MTMIFEAYRNDMRLRGIKPHSFTTYDRAVDRWLAYLDDVGVRPEDASRLHVQAFLLSTGWAPTTMKTALAYLRAAYGFAVDELEMLERNPARRVRLPRPEMRLPEIIPNRDLREMLARVRDDDDDLLLRLFVYTGMRTIEVRRLTWNDVGLADNMLRVHGKGDRWREVPIHPRLRQALVGRVFANGSIHVVPGRGGLEVTSGGLHYRMKRIAGRAKNHSFRRTVATSLRANGVQREVLKAFMGWADDGSIFEMHYNRVTPQELQAAVLKLYADDPV